MILPHPMSLGWFEEKTEMDVSSMVILGCFLCMFNSENCQVNTSVHSVNNISLAL